MFGLLLAYYFINGFNFLLWKITSVVVGGKDEEVEEEKVPTFVALKIAAVLWKMWGIYIVAVGWEKNTFLRAPCLYVLQTASRWHYHHYPQDFQILVRDKLPDLFPSQNFF